MPSKLQMYEQMADQTAKQVTGSFGEWTAFLETMGRLYKYPFHEQLMIFAQKPNATACADYDLWNKQMGRYVRRGTKGIALIDTSGDNPKLKYVFDVSDTGTRANSRRLNLWEYRDEHQDAVTASLENRFGVSGEKGLADQLEQIAGKLVTEYWNDNRRDILGILEDSFLEEYDDYNVEMAFRNAAAVSTTYTLMSRCGLNPGDYFEHEDFLSVFDFNTRDTIAVLGSAVSNSSEQILRQIAITVKNYEREASLQRQAERTQNDGEQSELYAERGLSDSQSDALRDRNEALGQVRSDEEKVPAGAQAGAVEQHDPVREPVSASEGDRRGSEPEAGTDDAGADEAERRDGEPESQRSDEVDRAYEQPQKPSRGSNSRRTDSRISGQLTLFDVGLFPTEQEQIAVIDEAESVKPTPFAFSFAQNDIDDVLRLASNTEDTRMTVAAAFQKQKSTEEIAELLKQEYHGGAGIKSEGGEFSVWYGEDGIHLAKGRSARYTKTAQIISWEDAAERIGQLMQDGRYASNVELAEAEGHERMKLSQMLWYLRGDLSDAAKEQNILSALADYRNNNFPDSTARLAEDLKDPTFRERLAAEYTVFLEAYKENRDVMRFHFHKTHEIWNRLKDLDLLRREYTSDMPEVPTVGMFITDDEIDATLNRGSNVEGGRGRIYSYLTGAHNAKEKTEFLKNEYGTGGRSHAVSGQGWIDSSGKGIRLQKPGCTDVELNWNKVLSRFENIIRNGRYFTPEEKARYEEMQTREWQFRKHMDAYNDIKHDHPNDVVLFQVGDFFEMYGVDARTASELLGLNLTTRAVSGAGRVEMCGIPSHILEQSVEKIRQTRGVTVARHNSIINEHTTYSLGVLGADRELSPEVENEPVSVTETPKGTSTAAVETPLISREITQAEIDEALQSWNGSIESKQAVVRYMADHARERDTAAWLAGEYGTEVSKPLHITVTGTDIDYEMSWAKVQRRIAQLIKEDRFYTQAEYDRLDDIDPIAIRETLAQHGIVNGEVVDSEKLDADPFIQQVMLLKCRYIDEITDSRGVVFATGTPVSNSMTELYTMMRYLQHDTIRDKGLAHFDCWASTFGETTTAIELAPEGTGYRARTRFAKFFNLPELMNLFKEAADIKTADQLNLPTPTPIYHNEVAQPTEIQQAMVQELSERAAAVHAGTVDPSVDNMLRITSDGRKLGLDQRIINPNLPDEPTSKVNMCVDNIHRIWEEGQENKLTQLVFCDLSTPKSSASKKVAKAPAANLDSPELRALEHLAEKDDTPEEAGFTVYDDIRDKLVARGIPREQIAFIHEANTEARKKELFSKVRSGQVRVLMGSTFKMGAGMNVQDRLIALHDLDAPWRPGDLEQRSGRIIRQGNMNPEVHIYRYVTEATFDAYLWQTLENKQKFISQIMTSKSPVRACDDIDETALSYAEIKALCAGDERIKEKMDLDVDVARLKLMKANHQSQQYRLEDNLLRYFPEQIEQSKGFIAGFEADMKTLAENPHPVDGFAGMTVRGDVLTDKENAGAALVDAFKEVKGLDPIPVGSYRGFQMSLTLEDFGRDYVLTLKGQMTHRVTLGKDPRGNLTRIDNALNGMADRLATVQSKLESLYSQMETAKTELGKPFPQEDELRVKSARLAELNIALNIDDKTPIEAMAEETPLRAEIAKSAKPSVLQKLHSYDKAGRTESTKKHKEETVR